MVSVTVAVDRAGARSVPLRRARVARRTSVVVWSTRSGLLAPYPSVVTVTVSIFPVPITVVSISASIAVVSISASVTITFASVAL